MENLKITAYEDGVAKLPDYPSDEGYTADMLKAVFDARSNKEIKEKHNALCDATEGISEALEAHKESPEAHAALFEAAREKLSVFVKNTDYATADKAGAVKINPYLGQSGLYVTSDGVLKVFEADKIDIEAGQPMAVITAGNVRYAMKIWGPAIENGEGEVSLEQKAWKDEAANSATGKGAAAFGGYNRADAKCAMAVNYDNEVKATNAFAANSGNKIPESCEAAFVAGHRNEANGAFQTIFGTYADATENDAFVIGNGNANGRKNAFKVTKAGDATAAGRIEAQSISAPGMSATNMTVYGNLTVAKKATVEELEAKEKGVIGSGAISAKHSSFGENIATGRGSVTFGGNNKVYGEVSSAFNTSNTIPEGLSQVFVAGHANVASASHQAIFGTYADPKTTDSFVVGNGNSAGRKNAFAVDRSGNVRIGGSLNVGSTTLTEADIKALKALITNQSVTSEGE